MRIVQTSRPLPREVWVSFDGEGRLLGVSRSHLSDHGQTQVRYRMANEDEIPTEPKMPEAG